MDFHFLNQNVLDNLFYILISILIFFVLLDNVKRLQNYKRSLLTACMSLSIFLSMKFPIYIDQYCVHDFRQIPFLIGTLYGGWPVGATLLIFLITMRTLIYGFNFLTVIVYIVIFTVAAIFSTKFKTLHKKKKLIASMFLSLFLAVLTTWIAVIMSDFFKVTEAYVFYFIILPPIVTFLGVYLVEVLEESIYLKSTIAKAEKMEVVSQLAASISHEVRNPLTVVKGFIGLLKEPSLSQDRKEQYIEHVDRELSNAESIISEYLAFAKPATEKVDNIVVDREIRSVIDIIKPLANMNSVVITCKLSQGIVRGNIRHFQQCFLNLIKNSIEAMPNGGELCVVTTSTKSAVTIKVVDNGVGMSKEQIHRFGEPYYSCKEKGTGLGSMVIVRTIQTMKGMLEIDSAVNEGTAITVKFPVYE